MANNVINTRIQHRYDSLDNWKSQNPVLLIGEVARVRMPDGSLRTKTGNGTSAFNSLAWDDKNLYQGDSSVVNIPDSNVVWGGPNKETSFGPIDAAMVSNLGANRFAFMPAEAVEVEYSKDGGSTWTDYNTINEQKIICFAGGDKASSFIIGKSTNDNPSTADDQLRITLTQSKSNVYNQFFKFVLYVSTNGSLGCKVTIQGLLTKDLADETAYQTFVDGAKIGGWSGYNVINDFNPIVFGGNNYQYGKLRFIFTNEGHDTLYPNNAGLTIHNILGFGGVGWATPSNLAKFGKLYKYDINQNAIFPSRVFDQGYTPLSDSELTNKKYVDAQITAAKSDVNKDYVDEQDAKKLDKVVSQSVNLSNFEITNSNSENTETDTSVSMTYSGTYTVACKNQKLGFTITGDSDTEMIPVKYNGSTNYVSTTPLVVAPVLMTTDLVIDNSSGVLGGTFTFSNMVLQTDVTPEKYLTKEILFTETNEAKLVNYKLKTTDFNITWGENTIGSFVDTTYNNLDAVAMTHDSYPVTLQPKDDFAEKDYALELVCTTSMGAPTITIYTSASDTTGTTMEISGYVTYVGKIYKAIIQFGLNATVNMIFSTTIGQRGLMSAEDKIILNHVNDKVGNLTEATLTEVSLTASDMTGTGCTIGTYDSSGFDLQATASNGTFTIQLNSLTNGTFSYQNADTAQMSNIRVYTSSDDTTGTELSISYGTYEGNIYKITGVVTKAPMGSMLFFSIKTPQGTTGLMSGEDKVILSNLQTRVGDISTALDSILTIQNNLLGGNS